MNKILVLLILLAAASGVYSQPFATGNVTLTLNDPDRQNRSVTFEAWYPADQPGAGVPVTTAVNARFPAVVFGHGFVMEVGAYANISAALVPEGYIVLYPTTEGSFSPSHEAFGKDIAFLADAFPALGGDPSSLFYQRTDTMVAVMGHSMGGGAAHLAAASAGTTIKAMATLAPAETTPSAIAAAASIMMPSLIIAGANDCVTPPATHQLPMYQALVSNIKTYISITGGSHCLMAQFNLLCNIGEISCTPAPTITREQQHAIINRYLIPWLSFHLKGCIPSIVQFENQLLTDTAITYLTSGGLVPGIGTPVEREPVVRIYPNPAHDYLRVDLPGRGSVHLRLFDARMQQHLSVVITRDARVSLSGIRPGLYLCVVVTSDGSLFAERVVVY